MVKDEERLLGNVQIWFPEKHYGFITVNGIRNEHNARQKQWHFHENSVKHPQSIAVGVVVTFTPKPCPAADKCDKATDVEVVG